MNTKNGDSNYRGLKRSAFPLPEERSGVTERLKAAVRAAGGNSVVALRAGVPIGTLNNFLRGTETRLSAAHRIALACGISLDWLMTGSGAESTEALAQTPEKSQISADLAEPAPTGINPAGAVDTAHLRQAIQIVDALGELRDPDAASKIVAAYDILTSRKP